MFAAISDLQEQANALASLTHDLSHCCVAKEHEIFQRFGLTTVEGQLLLAVADHEPVLPSVVADRMGVVRSRVTPLTQSLVQKGFLHRTEGDMDRRTRALTLTSSGRSVAKEAFNLRLKFHAKLLEGFSDPDRERLIETLRDLHARMNEMRKHMHAILG